MSHTTVYMKRNDRRPFLEMELLSATGVAVNLTGATITFTMRLPGGAVKVNAAACVVTNAAAGLAEYRWATGDTDTVNTYEGWFTISWSGSLETQPSSGAIYIIIE